MMRFKDVFSDLAVARSPQKFELEIYAEDAKILKDFVEYKKRKLGGEITTAEVFNRLLKVIWCDTEFTHLTTGSTSGDQNMRVQKATAKSQEKSL